MKQAFRGEVYDTATALLLARHTPASGIEALKGQRVFDLYRTPAGSYFKYETTASLFVEDEDPEIIPISLQEASLLYSERDDRELQFKDVLAAACFDVGSKEKVFPADVSKIPRDSNGNH